MNLKHFFLTFIFLLTASCSSNIELIQKFKTSNTNRTYRVVMIPKGDQHNFWSNVKRGAQKGANDEERISVEFEWVPPPIDDSIDAQLSVIEKTLTLTDKNKVDGLIIAPTDNNAPLKLISSLYNIDSNRKLPILVMDSELSGVPGKDFIGFVATENYQAGISSSENFARYLDRERDNKKISLADSRILVYKFNKGSLSTTKRESGFTKGLLAEFPSFVGTNKFETYGSLRGVGVTISAKEKAKETIVSSVETAYKEYLDTNKKPIIGIFCPNETTLEGLLLALNESIQKSSDTSTKAQYIAFLKDLLIVGFDISDKIYNDLLASSKLQEDSNHSKAKEYYGLIDATTLQDPYKIGNKSFKKMVDYLINPDSSAESVSEEISSEIITPNNLHEHKDLLCRNGVKFYRYECRS